MPSHALLFPIRSSHLVLTAMCLMLNACGDDEGAKKAEETCQPGALACECLPDDECNAGLFCEEGVCGGAVQRNLTVGDPAVRSCEVLLLESDGAKVLGVNFTGKLKGANVREAPRVAVTFAATEDGPIAAGAVGVLQSDAEGGKVEVSKVSCFDAKGKPVEEPKLSLGT